METVDILARAYEELGRAYAKHGQDKWGRHEFYGVLKEEVDEVWDAIKTDAETDVLVHELAQVVAMVVRYCDTGNRYGGGL